MGEGIGHTGRRSGRHHASPVGIERIDEFKRGFDQVFSDPTLGDEVHDGKQQEGFVGCAMVGNLRVSVPAFVGPKLCEHLEVFLKHRPGPRPHSVFSKKLEKL
jgi:hypothetical protein